MKNLVDRSDIVNSSSKCLMQRKPQETAAFLTHAKQMSAYFYIQIMPLVFPSQQKNSGTQTQP